MNSSEKQLVIGRRNALKMLGLSSAAMLAGGFTDILAAESESMKPKSKPVVPAGRSSVAFTTGTDRQQMLYEVVKPFEAEIKKGLKGKQLIIKPNMVATSMPLCATHVDAMRSLLEYLKPIYKGQIIIAESSSVVNSADGFKNYGYLDLAKDYNVKFVDLNTTSGKPYFVINRDLHLDKIQIADAFFDPNNYIISISRLKTHDTVVMTGAVKNIVLSAPLNLPAVGSNKPINYKRNLHSAGPRWLHYNMHLVSKNILPNFSIIDGVEGMEGNGPVRGTPVNHKIALAGFDPMSVDSICCQLMDIPLEYVGYLNYNAAAGIGIVDREKIDIIGSAKPSDHVIKYALNANADYQLEWDDPLNLPSSGPQRQRPAQQ
jgi:uncharacterized protein (DUF362 family)